MVDAHRQERRFWPRVEQSECGCWIWTGQKRSNGYGSFPVKRNGKWTCTTSHRAAYEFLVGPIPDGCEVDHLCRNRACVRPDHLEAVTVAENRRRRDIKATCDVDRNPLAIPTLPPLPTVPAKRDPNLFCPNGHEYAIVGRVSNGSGNMGQPRSTCAACRMAKQEARRKGNKASDRECCPKGHPYTGDNLWTRTKTKNGKPYTARECRTCTRERNRTAHRRRMAAK